MDSAQEPSEVGRVLRRLREDRGWTLRDLERRSEGQLKSGHLSMVEKGKVQEPSLSFLREAARVFNLDLRDLVTTVYPPPEQQPDEAQKKAEILSYFEDLGPNEQANALKYLRYLVQQQESADHEG